MVMANGNGPGGLTITKPVTKALRATLTLAREREKSARLRFLTHQVADLKAEVKAHAKRIKSQIEDFEREAWLLIEQLDTNSEVRDVACEELLDLDRNEVIVTRLDTREEIDRRGLKDDERAELKKLRQKSLPGIVTEAPKDATASTSTAATTESEKPKKRSKKTDKAEETTVTMTGPDGVERPAVAPGAAPAPTAAADSPLVIVGIPMSQWASLPTSVKERLQANIADVGINSGVGALSWADHGDWAEAGPVRESALRSLEELFDEIGLEVVTRDPNSPMPSTTSTEAEAAPAAAPSVPTHEGALDANDDDEPPPDPPEEFDALGDATLLEGVIEATDPRVVECTIERRAKGGAWERVDGGEQTEMAKRFDELLGATSIEDGLRMRAANGEVLRLSHGTKTDGDSAAGTWRVEIRTPSGGAWTMIAEDADGVVAAGLFDEHKPKIAPGMHIRLARPDGTTEYETSAPSAKAKKEKGPDYVADGVAWSEFLRTLDDPKAIAREYNDRSSKFNRKGVKEARRQAVVDEFTRRGVADPEALLSKFLKTGGAK